MRLILVRHGQINANKEGRWHGSTDSPLTWTGRRQAKRTHKWLKGRESFKAVYTSPLQRCQHTAALVSPEHEAVHMPDLAEMHIGEWENMPFKQLHEEHNFMQRSKEDLDYSAPGGESLQQVGERVQRGFESIIDAHQEHDTILIVSHGVALAVGMSVMFEDTPAQWSDYPLANCSITEIKVTPAPHLITLNQTTHL